MSAVLAFCYLVVEYGCDGCFLQGHYVLFTSLYFLVLTFHICELGNKHECWEWIMTL